MSLVAGLTGYGATSQSPRKPLGQVPRWGQEGRSWGRATDAGWAAGPLPRGRNWRRRACSPGVCMSALLWRSQPCQCLEPWSYSLTSFPGPPPAFHMGPRVLSRRCTWWDRADVSGGPALWASVWREGPQGSLIPYPVLSQKFPVAPSRGRSSRSRGPQLAFCPAARPPPTCCSCTPPAWAPSPTPVSPLGPHSGPGPMPRPPSLLQQGACLQLMGHGPCLPCGGAGSILPCLSPLGPPVSASTRLRPGPGNWPLDWQSRWEKA